MRENSWYVSSPSLSIYRTYQMHVDKIGRIYFKKCHYWYGWFRQKYPNFDDMSWYQRNMKAWFNETIGLMGCWDQIQWALVLQILSANSYLTQNWFHFKWRTSWWWVSMIIYPRRTRTDIAGALEPAKTLSVECEEVKDQWRSMLGNVMGVFQP